MIRSTQHQPTTDSPGRVRSQWGGLAFLVALASSAPGVILAADWLAPASDQAVTAPWVKDIAAQLEAEPYREVLATALGGPPNPAVVRYLNNAAQAMQTGNKLLAQSYVDRTIGILDSGVQRGYYTRSDVEPIKTLIRKRADAALKGEKLTTAQEQERWTGYTRHRSLGLVGEDDRMTREHPTGK